MKARLLAAALAHLGRQRLRHGYCPACNSSPPRSNCAVCDGSYEYGPDLDPTTRDRWASRWRAAVDLIR